MPPNRYFAPRAPDVPERRIFATQSGLLKRTRITLRAATWILLAISALPSFAAKRMTVAQLEQALVADAAAHKSDAEIARQISGVELSERLTDAALTRLSKQFSSNSPATTALLLLAERTAFLDPPPGELPSTPVPDPATQQHLLDGARSYAVEKLPQLPNLLATRTTSTFDNSPQELPKGGYPQRMGLHLMGSSKVEVSVRNDKESPATRVGDAPPQTQGGLMTWGEFGSTLLIILSDSAQGKVTWSHWEQTASGQLAVFHYEVPKAVSHFAIDTPIEQTQANGASERWAGTGGAMRTAPSTKMLHSRPAYQGSLWVDPATGSILRLSLVADLRGNPTFEHGAILVEYGPVHIADKTFILPVRSLALSSAAANVNTVLEGATTEWLNESLFTGYHLFASTTRILADNAPASAPAPAATPNSTDAKPLATAAAPAPQPAPTAAAPITAQQSSAATPPQPQSAPAPDQKQEAPPSNAPIVATTATVPPAPVAPSTESVTAPPSTAPPASSLPALPAGQAPESTAGSPTFRVNASEVQVPVVVRDRQGRAIGDLSKNDFTLFDQGKPLTITGFTLVKSAAVAPVGTPQVAEPGSTPPPVAATQNRFVVFLFDDRHLTSSDLAITQNAATKMLNEPFAPNEYAAVVSFMGVNSGVTRDRAALQAAIAKLSVHQAAQHAKEDCPDVDYYAGDRIVNQHDAMEFQVAVKKAKACFGIQQFAQAGSANIYDGMDNPTDIFQRMAASAAAHAVTMGEEEARETLLSIETVVRAMSKLSGERTLVLVSPGFLSLSPEAMNFKSQVLDQAAVANVVINALDARGLYAGNVDASQGPASTISQFNGQTSQDHLASMQASENAMAELADGTGGTFFHNNNDLAGGLRRLAAAPEYLYLLEFSLQSVKPTGTYHSLQINVDRAGVNVQARRGFFAPKEAKDKK